MVSIRFPLVGSLCSLKESCEVSCPFPPLRLFHLRKKGLSFSGQGELMVSVCCCFSQADQSKAAGAKERTGIASGKSRAGQASAVSIPFHSQRPVNFPPLVESVLSLLFCPAKHLSSRVLVSQWVER